MAIAPTGAIYKSLIFDGEDSREYGVYITGQAVYNAPERDVEMINIPGRNGAFALDKGRFQNIEVTYPAGIFADNEADFARAISDFRNLLCSRSGYVRLTDEYNPDEYRMAVYKSGLEVSPAQLKAGEFSITFDCKPQRFLTSGEEPITIGEWHETETASGTIASFEAKEGDAVKSLVVDIEPLQSGSGTPSPTNIRPISGYDSVVVSRSGKNIAKLTYGSQVPSVANGQMVTANGWSSDFTNVDNASNYVTSYSGSGQSYIMFYGADKNYLGYKQNITSYVLGSYSRWSDAKYVKLRVNGTASAEFTIQLEKGSTTTAYEPYQGNTYTTNLNGTRYGGTLDVASGVLTVTKVYLSLTADCWTAFNTSLKTAFTNGSYLGCTITNCDSLAPEAGLSSTAGYIGIRIADGRIGATPQWAQSITSLNDFKTALANNPPINVVYELATPTTVQLTAQEVELLVGLNQVWANSGDVEVEYGTAPNVLVNPTLFESSPMLEVEGYGTIAFNGYEIELENAVMGDVEIAAAQQWNPLSTFHYIIRKAQKGLYNIGDTLTLKSTVFEFYIEGDAYSYVVTGGTASDSNSSFSTQYLRTEGSRAYFRTSISPLTFTAGTDSTVSDTITISATTQSSGAKTFTLTLDVTYEAEGSYEQSYIDLTLNATLPQHYYKYRSGGTGGAVIADSTISILGHPTYIDCDLGEAYLIKDGLPISLNQHIDLGSDLPKLAAGSNEITFDNTITDLKILPRWWKV